MAFQAVTAVPAVPAVTAGLYVFLFSVFFPIVFSFCKPGLVMMRGLRMSGIDWKDVFTLRTDRAH